MHSNPEGGHLGIERITHKVRRLFYWRYVHQLVFECDVCQRQKGENVASPGLVHPLPIPTRIWIDISVDFVDSLPKSQGKEVILVVVDQLRKYPHFLAVAHVYTAQEVAQLFLDNIYRLHGMPSSIVSDRDPIFTSKFWQEHSSLSRVQV